MTPTARSIIAILVVIAGVLWLSSAPLRGWPLAVVVIAALVFGFNESIAQKRMERRWVKSWWTKWRNHV